MTNVFISYVRENKDIIDKLAIELNSYGIKVWIDRNEISPGIFWKTAIRRAITSGDFFIACFSSEYNSRVTTYMNEELTLAIEELRKRHINRTWFIPIIISGEIPDREISAANTLRDIQAIDLRELTWENALRRIISVIHPDALESDQRIILLQHLLSSEDTDDRVYAATQLGDIKNKEAVSLLIRLLEDQAYSVRRAAVESIVNIGADAKEALPILIKLFKNFDQNFMIVSSLEAALAAIGKHSISHLIDLLENVNKQVQLYTVRCLGQIGAKYDGEQIFKKIINFANDEDVRIRQVTIQSLGKLVVDRSLVIPELRKALKDESPMVRQISAKVLFELGKDASSAIDSIIEGMKDSNMMTRFYCISALLKIDEFPEKAIYILQDMEKYGESIVAKQAKKAMKVIKERQGNKN